MHFCQICPTPMLGQLLDSNHLQPRKYHLTLAHLQEVDADYVAFYRNQSNKDSIIIQDNSAFEMWKQCRPMFPTEKLVELALAINAKYVVMSDYPDTDKSVTIKAAEHMASSIFGAGMGTFFVPQAQIGNLQGLLESYEWALFSPLVNYIAFSILNVPNAYGVESDNKLQRYLSRYHFIKTLDNYLIAKHNKSLEQLRKANNKLFHFLGMLDGPNEIDLINSLDVQINSWDSSAAIWAGLNGIAFDDSPTGLVAGKFEKHVDFNYYTESEKLIELARQNMEVIDGKSTSKR